MKRNALGILIGTALVATLAGCDVNQTKEGDVTLPKYDVSKTQDGNITAPAYEVTPPEVSVRTEPRTVEVPVVRTEERQINVPNVDIKTPPDK